MMGNEKAEFAVKILLEYASENGINGRDTADLSPLEQWLILKLFNVLGQSEQFYCNDEKHFPELGRCKTECYMCKNQRLTKLISR